MKGVFTDLAIILQIVGAIVFSISLAILFFRIIVYKEDSNKRLAFMDGTVRLIIGIAIIGSMSAIVGFLYYYVLQLSPSAGLNIASASKDTVGKFFSNLSNSLNVGTGSFLAGLLGDLLAYIANALVKVFGLSTINQLIDPSTVTIFTSTQWDAIKGVYSLMILPSVTLMLFMVFKTGVTFMKSSVNSREITKAKGDVLRWLLVVLIIAGGPIIIKAIIDVGNGLTTLLNSELKGIMPNLNFTSPHFGNGLAQGAVQLYFSYITLRINILFTVRNITLIAFTIFTPIAAVLWGIDSSIVALPIWIGEIISNAFMAFALSIAFVVFSLVFDICGMNASNGAFSGSSLLTVIVGLGMILTLSSTFRNSIQGYLLRMSGIDEDSIAKRGGIGGLVTSTLGLTGAVRNIYNLKNTAQRAKDVIGEKFNSKADANSLEKNTESPFESSQMENLQTNAGNQAYNMMDQLRNQNAFIDKDTLEGGGIGNLNSFDGAAALTRFTDNIAKNRGGAGTRKNLINNSADDTIGAIANNLKQDENFMSKMPDGLSKAEQDQWLHGQAENKFAEILGIKNANKLNNFTTANGKDYLNVPDDLKDTAGARQTLSQDDSIKARKDYNNALDDFAKGDFSRADNFMKDYTNEQTENAMKNSIAEEKLNNLDNNSPIDTFNNDSNISSNVGDYTSSSDINSNVGDYTPSSDINSNVSDYTPSSDISSNDGDYTPNSNISSNAGDYASSSNISSNTGNYNSNHDFSQNSANNPVSSNLDSSVKSNSEFTTNNTNAHFSPKNNNTNTSTNTNFSSKSDFGSDVNKTSKSSSKVKFNNNITNKDKK